MRNRVGKNTLFIILIVILVALALVSICIGHYQISFGEFFEYLSSKISGNEYDGTIETVLLNLRLPRVIAAIVFGAALAVAGLVYQNVFSNNMVSPDLLGVSSSAACGAAIAIIMGASKYMSFFCSFFFSIAAIIATTLLSNLLRRKERLLLAGIIVAGFARSGLGLLKYIADPENGQLESIVYWEMGSLSKVTWLDLSVIVPIVLVILVLLFCLRRRINCLALKKNAALLGINVPLERVLTIALSSLLVSLSTAVCGVISWIGLIIPIAAADLTKSGSIEDNFAVTGLVGAIFLLMTDGTARAVTSAEIPISIMTGATGLIIFVISIFVRKEKETI